HGDENGEAEAGEDAPEAGQQLAQQLPVLQRLEPGGDDGADARNGDRIDELPGRAQLPGEQQHGEEKKTGPAFLHRLDPCPLPSATAPDFSCMKMLEKRRWRNAVKRSSSRVLIGSRGYGRSMTTSSLIVAGVLVR